MSAEVAKSKVITRLCTALLDGPDPTDRFLVARMYVIALSLSTCRRIGYKSTDSRIAPLS